MKIRLAISLLLVQVIAVHAQTTNQKAPTGNKLKSNVDLAVQKSARQFMDDKRAVGLSVGIYKDGRTYTYNYGATKKGTGKLPTEHTLYEIASITKTFTGLLLAQAVTEKRVNLDDDIRKYLEGSYPNLEFAGQPIKLVHLANHTSRLPGFLPDRPELFQNPDYDKLPFILVDVYKDYSRADFYKDLHKVELDKAPGVERKYSNSAVQLLGYILERVYGKSFEQLVAAKIANPLKMRDTKINLPGSQKKRLATGYGGSGKVMPYHFIQAQAAGGLHSSVSDMLKYIEFQLNESNNAVKLSHQVTYGSMDDVATGLYWSMDKAPNGIRDVWHSGGTFGFSSFCLISLESNFGVVLLSNEADPETQNRIGRMAAEIKTAIN